MTRARLPLAHAAIAAAVAAPLACAAAPSAAAAQDLSITVIEIESATETRDGAELRRGGTSDNPQISINDAECDASTSVTIQVRNFPAEETNLDFWRGRGVDCSSEAERNVMTGNCEHLFTENMGGSVLRDITRPVTDYIDCSERENGTTFTITGLATDSSVFRGPPGETAAFELQLDTEGPPAPTDVAAGRGDTQIRLSWESGGENVQTLFEFRVYADFETTGCEDAPALMPGEAPPDDLDPIETPTNSATSTNVSGSDLRLELGESRLVGLTAVDRARNQSVLSELACVTRVSTEGFCSVHEAGGGQCDGCAVGGAPAARRGEALALGLAGVALVVRRRWRRA